MPEPSIIVTIRNSDLKLREDLEKALACIPIETVIVTESSSVATARPEEASTVSILERLAPHSRALISRGRFHLTHSGFYKTVRMSAHYLREKTNLGPFRRGRNTILVTNEDLFAAMTILQRDVRDLRADLITLTGPAQNGLPTQNENNMRDGGDI